MTMSHFLDFRESRIVTMSTPRFPKNFVALPHPWPWRGRRHELNGHRCTSIFIEVNYINTLSNKDIS